MSKDDRNILSSGDEALKRMAEIYKSRYIGIEDMRGVGSVKMKIKDVRTERLEPIILQGRRIEGGEKGILVFDRPGGKKAEIVLNKTSYRNLKNAWGDNLKNWIGAEVELKLDKVSGKECCVISPTGGAAVALKTRLKKQSEQEPPLDEPPQPDDDLGFDGEIPEE